MNDYHKEYCKFHNMCMNIEMKSIEDHIHHYEIIEEMIGFQYWLHEKVATIYNSDMEYSKNHIADVFIHQLFYHNMMSLYASFLTSQQSLLHQTIPNLRTVYESIPKMYYISFFPSEIKYIILRDHIEGNDNTKAVKYLKSENALTIFKPNEINNTEELIEQVKPKYFFKWFTRKIYSEIQIRQLKSTYGLLSTSSHSSTIRRQLVKGYSKEDIGDTFEFIELLSFFNIVAELNGHTAMIEEKKISGIEISTFAEKMRAELIKDGKMGSLFPDHPDIVKKVMIHPPGHPWD